MGDFTPEEIKEAFNYWDKDHSGFIDQSELADALKHIKCKDAEKVAEMMIKQDDKDKDGKVSLKEFQAALGKETKSKK